MQVAGAVGEGAQRLHLGLQFGQLELHPLLVGQRGAEHLALLRPFDGLRDAVVHRRERTGGAPQALFLELLHLVDEALALFADAVALRHAHVVEVDEAGVARVHADLADLLGLLDAGQVHRHHHERLVAVHRALAGVDQHAHPVGLQAVGDPHLLAGDEVVVAVLLRIGLQARHIAARAGLAHADAADRVARDGGHQELAAQFVAAEACECGRAHVGLHADGHRHAAAADVAQPLGEGHRERVVEPGAAEGLGLVQAQQAEVAELLEDLVRGKDLGLFPFVDAGVDLLVDEPAQGVLHLEVFMGVLHHWSPFVRSLVTCPGTRAVSARGESRRRAAPRGAAAPAHRAVPSASPCAPAGARRPRAARCR